MSMLVVLVLVGGVCELLALMGCVMMRMMSMWASVVFYWLVCILLCATHFPYPPPPSSSWLSRAWLISFHDQSRLLWISVLMLVLVVMLLCSFLLLLPVSFCVVEYLVNLKVPNTLSKSVKHKSKVHGIDAKRLPPRQQ